MKQVFKKMTAAALMAAVLAGATVPVQTSFVYAEDVPQALDDMPDGEVVEYGMTYTPDTSSVSSGSTSKTTKTIKAPSANYTGFGKKGSATYYFENGKAVIDKLKKIDKKYYIFNEDGKMETGGLVTFHGKKYYANSDGTLLRSDWKTMKNGKYYYADNKCVVKTYEFKTGISEKSANNGYWYSDRKYYLCIDGKPAKASEFRSILGSKDSQHGFIRLGSDYYYVTMRYNEKNSWNYIERDTSSYGNHDVYDIGSKQKIFSNLTYKASLYDWSTEKVKEMIAWEQSTNRIIKIDGAGKKPVASNPGKIIVSYATWEDNSVGGIICSLDCINNTGKEIKYINYNVQCRNSVNDVVADTISRKKTFSLQRVGPIKPGSDPWTGTWKNIMYNTTVSKVDVVSVQVDFMDGSSELYYGKDLTVFPFSYKY
jgi:hypothetical protein